MHPSFSDLFVNPETKRPLNFLGSCENDRWTNGFLWSDGEHDMYPVIDGIPIFVPPSDRMDPERDLKQFRERWGPSQAWKTGELWAKEKWELARFAQCIAESEGLILDVASGPGGGLAPTVLHMNPEATILMDDLRLGLLKEWQRVLKGKGISKISFALFDATEMPLKQNSVDIIEDVGGFDNIPQGAKAVREAYQTLKPGGMLFSMNSVIVQDDLLELPTELMGKVKAYAADFPFLGQGFLSVFEKADFKVISHTFLKERELTQDDGVLSREAAKYGAKLRIKQYCTHLEK